MEAEKITIQLQVRRSQMDETKEEFLVDAWKPRRSLYNYK
jgi:hypothetical protein